MAISFDPDTCGDLAESARKEWLETNGLGGFASASVSGLHTRRYHGLLVAAVRPPVERHVLLSKLEETILFADGSRIEFGTNRFPGETVHPEGYKLQTAFRLDPFPISTFRTNGVEIEKTVLMPYGENTTVIRYRIKRDAEQTDGESNANQKLPVALELRPLVAFRDYHWLQRENGFTLAPPEIYAKQLRLAAVGGDVSLYLAHTASRVIIENVWYKQFEYLEEKARGFEFHEDLLNPCSIVFDLRFDEKTNETFFDVIASTQPQTDDVSKIASAFELSERVRRKQLVMHVMAQSPQETFARQETDDDFLHSLVCASDDFIVRRDVGGDAEELQTIVAGYHWFTDWGRDTMISLTGLALVTRRFEMAREILRAFAAYFRDGLIPNRFPDRNEEPEYNTVDGTLWFFHAAREYLRRTGDEQFIRDELYEKLRDSLAWHERGTLYDIRMTEDCLLRQGHTGVQLTWMDAKVNDWVVTPRTGKPVEIQALWYNALRTMEEFANKFGDKQTANHCGSLADGARASFHGLFWNSNEKCLYDVVGDDGKPDASVRPNQLFAVSLPFSLANGERARQIVQIAERDLLTPYGLRSLSPRDSRYRGRYEGDATARDSAYHQGTVWAWLIGAFITAYLKANGRTPETIAKARGWLEGFRSHLTDAGLGQVSEIFDGDAPHTPRGCIAQAWSVAEILRCEFEELV